MDVVTQGELAVSQEARDAAADWYAAHGTGARFFRSIMAAEMRDGSHDNDHFVQAFQRAIDAAEARQREADAKVWKALLAVIDATSAHLPPDGISERECINRILGAIDNPEISAAIREGTKI